MARIQINDLAPDENFESFLNELTDDESVIVVGGGKFWDWLKDTATKILIGVVVGVLVDEFTD